MTRSGYGAGGSSAPEAPLSDRLPPAAGDRVLLGLLIVLIVGVPTVFLRTTFTTFDISQITLLWLLAVAVGLVGVYRFLVTGVVELGPLTLTVASAAFLGALLLTSVLSDQPWVAFTGLTVRGAGAISYGLCLVLLHVVYRLGRRRSLQPLVLAFVGAHGLVVLYALLQAYGLDPFTWGSGNIYVGPVFSTLGNPNFSAGYVGLTLPLVTWVAFGSRNPVVLRVTVGAALGASSVALSYLNSFQGDVAALSAIAVLGHWTWLRRRRERLVAIGIVLPAVAVIAGVPLMLDAPARGLLVGIMTVVGASVVLGARWDQRSLIVAEAGGEGAVAEARTAALPGRRPWTRPAIVLMAVTAGAVLSAGRILDQLESGFEQRLEFWKVSLSIFRTSPLVGTGLETYSAFFTSHRSIEHAVSWETVLSDSPHSVPLGLLSGGGLLLSVAYAALVVVVGNFGVRAVRRAVGPERLLYGAVLASWVAYHVQSSVSMDMPGLMHTQWVLGGVLLAGGAVGVRTQPVLPWAPGRTRSPSTRQRDLRWRMVGVALPVVGVLALLLGPLTAPLRADLAAYRAQQALNRSDFQAAGDEILRAIDLQPRNGFYAEGMAFVYQESGLYDLALGELERSALLQPGRPPVAMAVARTAIRLNRLEEAAAWFETALLAEPYGPSVVVESAWFFNHIEQSERARELLFDFEALGVSGSPLSTPWRTVEAVYRQLGETVLADRALTCWGGGGVPVPVGCGTVTLDDCFEGANNTLDCVTRAVDDLILSEQNQQKANRDPVETVASLNFVGADLAGADLAGASFVGADFSGADLSGADLSGADFRGARLIGANLAGADLRGARLVQLNLTLTDLSGANLAGAQLLQAILSGANLVGASLTGTNLDGADLTGANLRKANLREAYMRQTELPEANLNEADLTMADLGGANLTGASFIGANLTRANLAGAQLRQAILTSADLTGAVLTHADFAGANLSGANLSGTDLRGARLIGVNLSGADLTGAISDKDTIWPEGFDPATSLLAVHPRSD